MAIYVVTLIMQEEQQARAAECQQYVDEEQRRKFEHDDMSSLSNTVNWGNFRLQIANFPRWGNFRHNAHLMGNEIA